MPPPTTAIFLYSSKMVKGFPKGPIKSSLSPLDFFDKYSVPIPFI